MPVEQILTIPYWDAVFYSMITNAFSNIGTAISTYLIVKYLTDRHDKRKRKKK